MSGEVRRGRTMSGQIRVSIINPESKANYLCDLKVEKPCGLRSWQELTRMNKMGVLLIFC